MHLIFRRDAAVCRRLQRTDRAFFQRRFFFLRLRRRRQRIATTTLQISLLLLLLLLPFSVPPPQTVRAISKQQGEKKGPIGSHRCQMRSPRRRRLVPPFLLGRPRSQYVQWREGADKSFFLVSDCVTSHHRFFWKPNLPRQSRSAGRCLMHGGVKHRAIELYAGMISKEFCSNTICIIVCKEGFLYWHTH